MRLLLDTHTLIWWPTSSENLPERILGLLEDPQNDLLLSIANVWEMQIKWQRGKLKLGKPLSELIANQQANNELKILPIALPHVFALQSLPDLHRDPFDRIMIAQTMVENLPFVSCDVVLDGYSIQRLW